MIEEPSSEIEPAIEPATTLEPAPEPVIEPAAAPRSPMVEAPVRPPQGGDTRTHIERINPGANPAYVPGALAGATPGAPPRDPQDPGPKQRYRLLAVAVHDDVRLPAGSVVELYRHQVGAHHELLDETPEPA